MMFGARAALSASFPSITVSIAQLLASKFNFIDKIDKKYFDSMYIIRENVANKLKQWVKETKDAYIIKSDKDGNINKHAYDFSKNNKTASNNMHLATRSIGKGFLTTATCFYKLPVEGGHAILYFTFDGKSIEDCKLLCLKQGADPKKDSSYYVKKLTGWKQIPVEEYKK